MLLLLRSPAGSDFPPHPALSRQGRGDRDITTLLGQGRGNVVATTLFRKRRGDVVAIALSSRFRFPPHPALSRQGRGDRDITTLLGQGRGNVVATTLFHKRRGRCCLPAPCLSPLSPGGRGQGEGAYSSHPPSVTPLAGEGYIKSIPSPLAGEGRVRGHTQAIPPLLLPSQEKEIYNNLFDYT